jgi:hypothetical protein
MDVETQVRGRKSGNQKIMKKCLDNTDNITCKKEVKTCIWIETEHTVGHKTYGVNKQWYVTEDEKYT